MFNFDLKNSRPFDIFKFFLLFCALVIPGFSKFLSADSGMFSLNTSFYQIILISIFYSLPVLFINFTFDLIGSMIIGKGTNVNVDPGLSLFGASIQSLLMTYFYIIFLNIFSLNRFGYFKGFYILTLIVCVISFGSEYLWKCKINKQSSKNSNK